MNDARMNGRHSPSASTGGVDIPDNFDDYEDEEGEENGAYTDVVLGAGQVQKSLATKFYSSKMMNGLVVFGIVFLSLFLSGIGISGIMRYNKNVAAMKSLAISQSDTVEDCDDLPDRHLESLTWAGKNGEFESEQTPVHLQMNSIRNADTNERNLVSSTPNEKHE